MIDKFTLSKSGIVLFPRLTRCHWWAADSPSSSVAPSPVWSSPPPSSHWPGCGSGGPGSLQWSITDLRLHTNNAMGWDWVGLFKAIVKAILVYKGRTELFINSKSTKNEPHFGVTESNYCHVGEVLSYVRSLSMSDCIFLLLPTWLRTVSTARVASSLMNSQTVTPIRGREKSAVFPSLVVV